jgi:hypothetical protein
MARRSTLIAAGCALFLIVGLPAHGMTPSETFAPWTLPAPDNGRLALSDIKDAKPESQPDGKITAPNVDSKSRLPQSIDEEEPTTDTLETDVTHTDERSAEQINISIDYDLSKLPEPVRRMRELIVEAAVKGDIEGLRPLLGSGINRTELSIGGYEGDPIDFLKETSGDAGGHELLAILLDIFQTGYAHLDAGEPTEMFLWPYFYSMPLDGLDDRQKVELFRIITAGDYEDMQAFGSYVFYRTAIGPEGDWKFFVAGD